MEPPFDIYAGLFSVGEIAEVAAVSRPLVDVWIARGVIAPTRREKPTGRRQQRRARVTPRRGRPLFSCRDAFRASLVRLAFERVAISSTDSTQLADDAEAAAMPRGVAGLADLAASGEWMWAVARSIERGKPLTIYGYATRAKGKWSLDFHVDALGAEPCFGWNVPFIFIPMSSVFADVYGKCKALLGVDANTGRV